MPSEGDAPGKTKELSNKDPVATTNEDEGIYL